MYRVCGGVEGLRPPRIILFASVRLHDRTLAELNLPREHGLTSLAIYRGDSLITAPSGEVRIASGDKLVVFGKVADACAWSE